MSKPRLVISYGRRYEPQWLVDEMLANVEGIADDIFCLDDRARPAGDLWIGREEFNGALRDGALRMGADYMLVIAPDERLEKGAGPVIRELVGLGRPFSYKFNLREMWTPTAYRVDGLWGRKRRLRLHYLGGEVRGIEHTRLNIYHLHLIEPENRASRAEIHKATNKWDNGALGFDYMTDERGMRLERIPAGREFYPPYSRPYVFSTGRAA